jgi:hypothetical protein
MNAPSLALIAILAAAQPLAAQDIFKPLQDFVEELAPPRSQPRPAPNPVTPTPSDERPVDETAEEPPLPRPRPDDVEPDPAPENAPENAAPPPDRVYQTACPALLSGKVVGEMLAPIAEGICGERSPLAVTGINVNGHEVSLSSPVTTNCAMAGALADWVGDVDAYARAALNAPVAVLNTGTSMMCRNRNGGDEEFVSEHGFANALDVVGFTLADGRSIAVESDWMPASAPEGKLLRQAHGAACGLFSTVLGPDANAEHEDHLHVDLGCHGQSCVAQICE